VSLLEKNFSETIKEKVSYARFTVLPPLVIKRKGKNTAFFLRLPDQKAADAKEKSFKRKRVGGCGGWAKSITSGG